MQHRGTFIEYTTYIHACNVFRIEFIDSYLIHVYHELLNENIKNTKYLNVEFFYIQRNKEGLLQLS